MVCFLWGDGVFFVNFIVNVLEEGGGVDCYLNFFIFVYLNVIVFFMIVLCEIIER